MCNLSPLLCVCECNYSALLVTPWLRGMAFYCHLFTSFIWVRVASSSRAQSRGESRGTRTLVRHDTSDSSLLPSLLTWTNTGNCWKYHVRKSVRITRDYARGKQQPWYMKKGARHQGDTHVRTHSQQLPSSPPSVIPHRHYSVVSILVRYLQWFRMETLRQQYVDTAESFMQPKRRCDAKFKTER